MSKKKEQRKKRTQRTDRCGWCNGSGYFSDMDVDFGLGRFGVCAGCAATGLAIGLTHTDTSQLLAYRFKRDNLGRRLAELDVEYGFVLVVLAGRTEALGRIDEALAILASVRAPSDAQVKRIGACSRLLDLLFRLNPRDGYEGLCEQAAGHCECHERIGELRTFAALVQLLPRPGTAAAQQLAADIERLERGYLRNLVATQKLGDLLAVRRVTETSPSGSEEMREEIRPSLRLGRILGFGDGLRALLEAGVFAASDGAHQARAVLESGEREKLVRGWACVEPLVRIYTRFKAGLLGEGVERPKVFGQNLLHCVCQELRAAFVEAREKVLLLFPAEDTVDWERLKSAAEPHCVRIARECSAIKAELDKPLLFDELLLLLKVYCHWVQVGRPQGCYAERLADLLRETLRPRQIKRGPRTAEELAEFEPIGAPVALEGLSAELLADLADVVIEFGTPDASGPIRRLSNREPFEIHVAMTDAPTAPTKFLIIGPGAMSGDEGTHLFRIGRADQPKAVLWDRRVGVTHVRSLIVLADEIRRTQPHRQPPRPTSEPKYRVDAVFAKRGAGMAVLPGGPDAETLRQQFDHPEEVVVATNPFGGTGLHHRRDAAYLAFRERVAMATLNRNGIADFAALGALSIDRILELRKEIEVAIAAAGEFSA